MSDQRGADLRSKCGPSAHRSPSRGAARARRARPALATERDVARAHAGVRRRGRRCSGRSRRARVDRRRQRARVLCGPRPRGDDRDTRRGVLRRPVHDLRADDDAPARDSPTRDREGARGRDRGRVSARRRLRSRGCIGVGALRDAGRQHRVVLLHADGARRARSRPQACVGDAVDGRDDRRADRARVGARQPGRGRRPTR